MMLEEWEEWLTHPMTRAVRRAMASRVALLKEQWAAGTFTDVSQYGTAILNAKAIGACEAYTFLTELDFEQLEGELDGE